MKNKIYLFTLGCMLISATACDSYLDKLPDKRATVNTEQKAEDLLVSAYPSVDPMMIFEHRTDNAMDNGKKYGIPEKIITENYYWKDVTGTGSDSPEGIWQGCYKAISTANIVLQSLKNLSNPNPAIKGEALLCRAYGHFLLVNTFCNPYSEKTADKDLGIPYVTEPEDKIGVVYERGTVKQVFEQIEKDLVEGYELINDGYYKVPVYHFNKRAAAAFAARFFLYYRKFDKALEYANKAIQPDPTAQLRDLKSYQALPSSKEWRDRFVSKSESANLLLIPLHSRWGRRFATSRYGNSQIKCSKETYRSAGPWGGGLPSFDLLYGGSGHPVKFQPKYLEFFEYTDVSAGIGYVRAVKMAFTTDETLMCRAEAEVMLKKYEDAARDLSYWYVKKGGQAADVEQIVNFYTKMQQEEAKQIKDGELPLWLQSVKPFHTDLVIEPGVQEMMLQAVLHARRIETMYDGWRWLDIRRFGIEVVHNVDEGEPITLKATDIAKRVIQLPESVISAGMEANPKK